MGGRLLRQRLLRRRSIAPKSKRGWTRWAICCGRPSCAPSCASSWRTFSTSSGCSPRSPSAAPVRASCWRSGKSLEKIPALKKTLLRSPAAARLRYLHDRSTSFPKFATASCNAISDKPPLNIADGGTIRAGYNAELDELRDLSQNGRQYIAQIETRERTRTGIQSLKVRFNNVFGYYIEISKANLHLAPADYERKQTLVNAERFTTPELKDYERKVLAAEEKILELRKGALRRGPPASPPITPSASAPPPAAIAELDVTGALGAGRR